MDGGETIDLGGGATVSVHALPGHTAGSVAYRIDGQGDVFVGDAVQVHGAANGFPGYADPAAYRASLRYLRDELAPRRLYLGHPYRRADGTPYGVELDAAQAREAIGQSLDAEAAVAEAACLCAVRVDDGSPYAPFAAAAARLGYTGDPTSEPAPFFTSLSGYHPHHPHHDDTGATP
ncbi:MBL fold metallo-hydrolase [Kitasatospora phosalacinea]|uniref:MBL fold metallo-hydrolase n=1 Tax=Kitasatospora phosalacinea TaxID=2065 RepID=UPI0036531740